MKLEPTRWTWDPNNQTGTGTLTATTPPIVDTIILDADTEDWQLETVILTACQHPADWLPNHHLHGEPAYPPHRLQK